MNTNTSNAKSKNIPVVIAYSTTLDFEDDVYATYIETDTVSEEINTPKDTFVNHRIIGGSQIPWNDTVIEFILARAHAKQISHAPVDTIGDLISVWDVLKNVPNAPKTLNEAVLEVANLM